jgi:hypothetical protein
MTMRAPMSDAAAPRSKFRYTKACLGPIHGIGWAMNEEYVHGADGPGRR